MPGGAGLLDAADIARQARSVTCSGVSLDGYVVGPDGDFGLVSGGPAEEIERLRAEPARAITIGGATLAAEAAALDGIDEYRVRLYPVLVGRVCRSSPGTSAGWTLTWARLAPSARKSPTSAIA